MHLKKLLLYRLKLHWHLNIHETSRKFEWYSMTWAALFFRNILDTKWRKNKLVIDSTIITSVVFIILTFSGTGQLIISLLSSALLYSSTRIRASILFSISPKARSFPSKALEYCCTSSHRMQVNKEGHRLKNKLFHIIRCDNYYWYIAYWHI